MREVRESLPRGYYGELPELATGHLAGYPRVYEIATTLISHTEGAHRPGERRAGDLRVPGGRAALDRRAVGGAGDAAARPDRERASHGAAHDAAAGRGGGGRPVGGAHRRRASDDHGGRRGAERVHRPPSAAHAGVRHALPAPAPLRRSGDPVARVDRAVAGRGRAERRGRGGARERASRADAGDDGEQHHQPARHQPAGLEGARRAEQRPRDGAARRPGGRLPADDVQDARSLPPRRRAHREADEALGARRRRDGAQARRRRTDADSGRRGARARRLLSGGRRAAGARSGDRLHAARRRWRSIAGCSAPERPAHRRDRHRHARGDRGGVLARGGRGAAAGTCC